RFRSVTNLAAERPVANLKRNIRSFGRGHADTPGAKDRNGAVMLMMEVVSADVQGRKIDAIDEILGRQCAKADWVRTAIPMKVHGPSATRVKPFNQSTSKSGTIALMQFRQPNKNVDLTEETAKRLEFF